LRFSAVGCSPKENPVGIVPDPGRGLQAAFLPERKTQVSFNPLPLTDSAGNGWDRLTDPDKARQIARLRRRRRTLERELTRLLSCRTAGGAERIMRRACRIAALRVSHRRQRNRQSRIAVVELVTAGVFERPLFLF
jgi:hypothetical protein